MQRRRQGKAWEGEISRGLRAFQNKHPSSFFYWRLADTQAFIQVPNVVLPKQPFDYLALYGGKFYGLEAKSTHSPSFPFEHLREHQREALMQVTRAGGRSVLLMSFRRGRPVRCYAVDFVVYRAAEEALSAERKSVPEEAVASMGILLPRFRGGVDLSPLFTSEFGR